jgi:diguanylate cyclase (GGDEF)-like protein/PAS domain S-box-containing protein
MIELNARHPTTAHRPVKGRPRAWRPPTVRAFAQVSPRDGLSVAVIFALAASMVVATGWLVDSANLRSIVPGAPPVSLATAGAIGLFAAALIALRQSTPRRSLVLLLTIAGGSIGVIILILYALGWPPISGAQLHWARMSPVTAVCLTLLAAGILGSVARAIPVTSLIALVAAASLSSLNLFNMLFQGGPPSFLAGAAQMSPITAMLVLALTSTAFGLAGSDSPLQALRGSTPTAALSRRLMIAAVVLPAVVVSLRVRGEAIGLYDSRFGSALMLIVTVAAIGAVVLAAATKGRVLERDRVAAQAERDQFFDLSLDLLSTATADGRYTRLNPAWTTTLGYPLVELRDRPYLEFVHPDDRDATLYEMHRQFAEGKTVVNFQNRFRHANGTYRWLDWTSQPSPDGSLVHAVARDVTVQKLEELRLTERAAALATRNERLADRAVRDPLTRLHNRAYLTASLTRFDRDSRKLDRPKPLAAIMFDLDNFGAFNKKHGHQAGDLVLRTFADILRRRFRGGDLICRYGGEEFVVLLSGASRDDAFTAADHVREQLQSTSVSFDGEVLQATVSAGCAERQPDMSAA